MVCECEIKCREKKRTRDRESVYERERGMELWTGLDHSGILHQ